MHPSRRLAENVTLATERLHHATGFQVSPDSLIGHNELRARERQFKKSSGEWAGPPRAIVCRWHERRSGGQGVSPNDAVERLNGAHRI